MLGEAMDIRVPLFIFVAILLALAGLTAFHFHRRRHEEALVRAWCDARGYAINRIETINNSVFATMLLVIMWLSIVGWLAWWGARQRAWRLEVYDDEGGLKTILLRVHRHGHIEETWE